MITDKGKTHIKKYMARITPYIGRSIAIGVGNAAESASDTALQMEVARAEVTLTTYDFTNDRLVFKAALPTTVGAQIYEVGLWTDTVDSRAGNFGSKVLSDFDITEAWTAGTYVSTNTRVGVDSLRLQPAVSATTTATKSNVTIDLSSNSGADYFALAYQVVNSFVSNVKVRFKVDTSNYYEYTVATTPTTGYKITTMAKSAATVVGTPTWANIQAIEVSVTSTAGGSGAVDFDILRIEDVDTYNPDYALVARTVYTQPLTKIVGQVKEVEFNLDVTIT